MLGRSLRCASDDWVLLIRGTTRGLRARPTLSTYASKAAWMNETTGDQIILLKMPKCFVSLILQ